MARLFSWAAVVGLISKTVISGTAIGLNDVDILISPVDKKDTELGFCVIHEFDCIDERKASSIFELWTLLDKYIAYQFATKYEFRKKLFEKALGKVKKTHWLYEVELPVGQYRLGASGNDESFFNNLKDPVGTLDAILPSHYAGPDVVWWS